MRVLLRVFVPLAVLYGAGCAAPGSGDGFHELALEPGLDDEELAFLSIINDYRAENDRGALVPSPTLTVAADAHSFDMGERDFFDHVNLDGETPPDRCQAAGYPEGCGENILAGRPTAAEAFASWRKSPGHNENMLRPEYTAIGIGRAFAEASEWGWYWTNTFGDVADDSICDLLPVSAEVCDGLDNDCDGEPDDGIECGDGGGSDGGCSVLAASGAGPLRPAVWAGIVALGTALAATRRHG